MPFPWGNDYELLWCVDLHAQIYISIWINTSTFKTIDIHWAHYFVMFLINIIGNVFHIICIFLQQGLIDSIKDQMVNILGLTDNTAFVPATWLWKRKQTQCLSQQVRLCANKTLFTKGQILPGSYRLLIPVLQNHFFKGLYSLLSLVSINIVRKILVTKIWYACPRFSSK